MSKIVERGTGEHSFGRKTGAGNRAYAAVAWLSRVFLVGLAMMVGLTQVASAQQSLTVVGASTSVSEGSTSITLRFTASNEAGHNRTLEYTPSDTNGAVRNQDYSAPDRVIVPAGSTFTDFTITILQDRIFEGNESFNVKVGASSTSITLTITDDDTVDTVQSITTNATNDTVTEGDTGSKSVIVTVTLAGSVTDRARPVTLAFDSTGTAKSGTDFTVTNDPPTVSVPANQTSATFTITVVGDILDESNETIVVSHGTGTSKLSRTITITDDDDADAVESVKVRLSTATSTTLSSSLSVTEGGVNSDTNVVVTLTMAATRATSRTFTLTRTGTALPGSDFTPDEALTFTINASQQSASITLTIKGDILVESDETIVLTASGSQNTSSSATITITNDDFADAVESLQVRLATSTASSTTLSVTEGNLNAKTNVIVTLTMAATTDGVRNLSLTRGGTAAAPSDFTPNDAQPKIAISAGQQQGTYTLTVNGDILAEADETIEMTVTGRNGATSKATITITNDDNPNAVDKLTFNPRGPIKEGDEGSQAVELTVTMAAKSSASRTVTLDFADSTAQIGTSAAQGVDFTTSSKLEVTIAANATTGKYSIAILGDIVDEDDEQIFVTAKVSTAPDNSGTRSATFTITDDDTFAVRSITATPDRVSENGDTVDVVVQYTATLPAARDENVTYAGSATPGVDFTGNRPTLNIPVATLTSRFRLTMVPDDLREEDETIVITLRSRTVTVTIIDEDTGIAALDEVRQQAGAALLRRNTQRFAFMTNNLVTKRLSGQSANAVSGDGRKVFVDVGASLNALGPKAQRDNAAARDRFANVWTSVEATRLEGDVTGEVFDVYAGADFRLTPDSIVGVLVSYETADVSTEKHDGRLEADGWSVGAYAGVQLAPNLTWDIAGSYGRQTPDVYARAGIRSFYGKYTSNRYLVASHLTGHVALDNGLVVKPTVGVLYGRDAQDRLTDSRGNQAAARKLELGRLSVGPQVSYSHALPEGWGVLDLTASATGFYDVLTPEAEDPELSERLSGAFSLGLSWSNNAGTTLDLGGSVDGVGLKGYDAYNVTGKLKFDF